jgi:hypothetical protein
LRASARTLAQGATQRLQARARTDDMLAMAARTGREGAGRCEGGTRVSGTQAERRCKTAKRAGTRAARAHALIAPRLSAAPPRRTRTRAQAARSTGGAQHPRQPVARETHSDNSTAAHTERRRL